MAANTVLPVMFGNSARIVSHTIPAYEPALCLGCEASQPYTQPTLQIRWEVSGAGRLQPAGAQPIVW